MRGGRTSTTRPKGSGASIHGSAGPAKGAGDKFTDANQPPADHKVAGKEGRALYLAKLQQRQDLALEVIDNALAQSRGAEDVQMIAVGTRTAFGVLEALHGRATQAVTGEDGGPLTVVIRRMADDATD